MQFSNLNYQKIKKKYLKFLKSQEIMSEPFRYKLGQFKKFYLPICKLINDEYIKEKKQSFIGANINERKGKFYLRIGVLDKPGVLADITRFFKRKKISISSMFQLEKKIVELAEIQKLKRSKLFLREMLFYLSLQMNLKKK